MKKLTGSFVVGLWCLLAVGSGCSAAQSSDRRNDSAATETQADRDFTALGDIMRQGPPKSRTEDPRGYFEWQDRMSKSYEAAAIEFARKHPQDARRWEGIVQMGFIPPLFISGFKREFDAEPDVRNLLIDAAARSAFERRLSRLLGELDRSQDASDRARMGALGARLSLTEAVVKREPSPQHRAALKAVADTIIARYPDKPVAAGAAESYLHVLQAQVPEEGKAYAAHMEISKIPAIAEYVRQQHKQQASLTDISAWKFTAADGRPVDVSTMRGKVVLIDFWATWCTPCIAEFPNIKTVYASYHDRGFEVIGVSVDDAKDKQKVLELVSKRSLPWPQYFDGKAFGSPIAVNHLISRVPSMFLLDKAGRVVSTDARGPRLEAEVKRLLGL